MGKSIIEKLAIDIKKNTVSVKGLSTPNLWFMKQFYEEYHDREFLKQLVSVSQELSIKNRYSLIR